MTLPLLSLVDEQETNASADETENEDGDAHTHTSTLNILYHNSTWYDSQPSVHCKMFRWNEVHIKKTDKRKKTNYFIQLNSALNVVFCCHLARTRGQTATLLLPISIMKSKRSHLNITATVKMLLLPSYKISSSLNSFHIPKNKKCPTVIHPEKGFC